MEPTHRRRLPRRTSTISAAGGSPVPETAPTRGGSRRRRTAGILTIAVVVVAAIGLLAWLDPGWLPFRSAPPLSVHVSSSPSAGYTPFTARLNASTSGGAGNVRITWSVNATTVGTGSSLSYYTSLPGSYQIVATAVDGDGDSAQASATVIGVSPLPEGAGFIPPASSDLGPTLVIVWNSSTTVSVCLLAGYGSFGVPPFAECAAYGGGPHSGTAGRASFGTDPDDPEPTPVLVQSTSAGAVATVHWWYNDSSSTEGSGALTIGTEVAPLPNSAVGGPDGRR